MTLIATRVKLGMHTCIWGRGYKPEMKDRCIQGSREIGGIVIESPKQTLICAEAIDQTMLSGWNVQGVGE